MLRAEAGPANYARFQGVLETEINFYERFVPSLQQLRCPLPRFFPLVWSDYSTLNREVLLLEDMTRSALDQLCWNLEAMWPCLLIRGPFV